MIKAFFCRDSNLCRVGDSQSLVAEIIAWSPCFLRGDADQELCHFLEKFKNAGVELQWLEERIKGGDSCDWKCMFEVMCLLGELGLKGEQLAEVIKNHPALAIVPSAYPAYS